MFEKWFKENNENIYILREDLDILKSNKDLNILNLYLNLNKKNGEFGIEELLKDMILIKENIIKEYDKDRSFEIKIINQNQNKENNIEISEDVLKENWDNILKYITIGEPLFYQMIKNSIPFNVNKIDKAEEIEDSNEYNIVIAFANNPVLYLKNKNFEITPACLNSCISRNACVIGKHKFESGDILDCFNLSPEYVRLSQAQRDMENKGK